MRLYVVMYSENMTVRFNVFRSHKQALRFMLWVYRNNWDARGYTINPCDCNRYRDAKIFLHNTQEEFKAIHSDMIRFM